MRSIRLRRNSFFCRAITGVLAFCFGANILANPTGMHVRHGSASASQNGSKLTVTASDNAFINWQSFNIAAGETTTFVQPSSTSVVWNRINDPNPTQIYGSLQANGVVVLLNSSGFYFGPNAFVSTAGLVVSTANCAPPENGNGTWEFNGPPPLASIVNYGRISVGQKGSAFLIADQVENHGTIEAPGGTIGLAAGQTVMLSERPDGRGMSLQVTLPQGSVDNYGTLIADAGTIAMNAKVINQNGIVQANSVRAQNGVIELIADDQLNLGTGSQIIARGDDSSPGSFGGSVTLRSANNFSDSVGSQIVTSGGAQGGNGGNVEVSAPNILSLNSSMDAGAQNGWLGGMFLLDPVNLILGMSTAGGAINVNTAFAGYSSILLQATGNITINADTTWNLSSTTHNNSGLLTLEAGGDIFFNNNGTVSAAKITDANNWSVALAAGYSFANNTVLPGVGNIFLNGGSGKTGGGSIQLASGNVNLTAGQSIAAGTGFVITTHGGGITAHALSGNIDTGTDAIGYHFNNSVNTLNGAYDLSSGLGGFSTEAGGNVSLTAGGNVNTVLPANNKSYSYKGTTFTSAPADYRTAGSGAYGRLPGQTGNVTIVAGGNVTGQYLVANGTGSIYAGVLMDAFGNPMKNLSGNYVLGATGSAGLDNNKNALALSLISGGWNVTAAQNIVLQEVRNPNGDFNVGGGAAVKHYFDYAPGDYVNLSAGNSVQLGASASTLPRADNLNVPVIYPSILNISAGAGGVILTGDDNDIYNQLILFPSPLGSLTINTTAGGSLVGNLSGSSQDFNLIVSDSGSSQYLVTPNNPTPFALNDHAATPVHLGNSTPITLNISGNMDLVLLGAPEAAQINVGGNLNNSRFQGMNLASGDVTSIHVTGDINNRGDITFVDFRKYTDAQVPDLAYLSEAVGNSIGNTSISAAALAAALFYNPTTKLMVYQNVPGQTVANVLSLLQNLTVQVYANGVPQWADDLHTIPLTKIVSVITPATALALLTEYNADNVASALANNVNNPGAPPDGTGGYFIGGGGQFDIAARNIDLGTTAGIQSLGVSLYTIGSDFPLAKSAGLTRGADISVAATGDLDMFSTSIASINGGNISINAGGEVNVGSADFTVNASGARGIYSTSGSDASVYAGQDINLNGSRIAAFDGGNVTVESFHGDINAGDGGLGGVTLTAYYVDPVTHIVYQNSPTAYGSGILAETFGPRSSSYQAPGAIVGNILVETPNGNIIGNKAGILQLAFNNPTGNTKKIHTNKNGPPPPIPPDSSHAIVEVLAGYELRDSTGHPLNAAQIANGIPVPIFSPQNVLSLGSAIDVLPKDAPNPVSLTQILDSDGQPLQAAKDVPLYVQSLDASKQIVFFTDQKIQPYLDASGDPLNVGKPLDVNGQPFLDANGNAILVFGRNIDAKNSGVIAQNAILKASGNIDGAIFAKGNINVAAGNNANVTALAQGTVTASAGDTLSGTIVGIGGISASGGSVDATLLSNGAISGGTSGQSGFAQGTAANATATAASNEANQTANQATTGDGSGDEDQKKKKPIALAQKVGRVTVILPTKTN